MAAIISDYKMAVGVYGYLHRRIPRVPICKYYFIIYYNGSPVTYVLESIIDARVLACRAGQ